MAEDIIGYAGLEQTWLMFLEYMEEYREVYDLVFYRGIKISFNINNYLRGWGVKEFPMKGQIVFISNGNKIVYTKEEVDEEINMRISLMKRVLREVNARKPIAVARNWMVNDSAFVLVAVYILIIYLRTKTNVPWLKIVLDASLILTSVIGMTILDNPIMWIPTALSGIMFLVDITDTLKD